MAVCAELVDVTYRTAAGAVDVKPRVASVTLKTGISSIDSFYTLMHRPNRTAKLFDGAASGPAVSEWIIR